MCVDWERVVLSTAGEQGGDAAADVKDGETQVEEEKKKEHVTKTDIDKLREFELKDTHFLNQKGDFSQLCNL